MEGNKISRQGIVFIIHKSTTYAQSNSSLEEDYLWVKKIISTIILSSDQAP